MFGTYDMYNTLILTIERNVGNAKLSTIALQQCDLGGRLRISYHSIVPARRNRVVRYGNVGQWAPHFEPIFPQRLE